MGRHELDVMWPEGSVVSRDVVVATGLSRAFYRCTPGKAELVAMCSPNPVGHRDWSSVHWGLVNHDATWIDEQGNLVRGYMQGFVERPGHLPMVFVESGDLWTKQDL